MMMPTMKDRAMQALYLLALDPIAEVTGDRNSYGFRKERSTADAIAQCFTVLSNRFAPQWVLEGDIKACFDRIGHEWLQAHIPMEKSMLSKWLKAGFMEKSIWYPTLEGTPQGGLCSPVLANLTLDGLEKVLREKFPQTHQKSHTKVNMVRYADDFLITGDSQALLEQEVKPLVETFMRERGLELSPEKTVITHISAGFDFLGQNRSYVRRQDAHQTIEEECQSVPGENPHGGQGTQAGHGRKPDLPTEPDHSRMDALPSARSKCRDVRSSGRSHLQTHMALGQKKTSP